jgi:hypothetical protein
MGVIQVVICALHRLMNESDLYKNSGITIDEKWIEENINENYDLSDNIEKESNEAIFHLL